MGSSASVDVLKAFPRGCFGSPRVTTPHLLLVFLSAVVERVSVCLC